MELDNAKLSQIRHKIIELIYSTNNELKNIKVVLGLKELLGMFDDTIDGGVK